MFHHHRPSVRTRWATANWCLLPLLLLALLGGAGSQPVAAARAEPRVLPQLQDEAAKHPSKTFRLLVTRTEKSAKADDKVKGLGGTKLKDVASDGTVFV